MSTKVLTMNMPIELFIKIKGDRTALRELLAERMKERKLVPYYGTKITYTLRVNTAMYNELKLAAELNGVSLKDFICDLLNGGMHVEED